MRNVWLALLHLEQDQVYGYAFISIVSIQKHMITSDNVCQLIYSIERRDNLGKLRLKNG